MVKPLRSATALVAALVIAFIAPAASPAAGLAPYEINVIGSTTGPAAVAGVPVAKGVEVLETLVNAGGGIAGRPVKFVIADDQSNPQVAVQLVSALKAKNVPVIVGPMITASCNAVAPLVTSGPVSFCISPYVESTANGYLFGGGPKPEDMAAAVLRFFRERGQTRIATLNATDASGLSLEKAFDHALALPENKALSVVARTHFAPADQTTTAQIAQIKAANPQVLISFMVGAPFATMIRGMHDGGLDVPVVTNGANMSAGYLKQLGALLPKEIYFAAYPGSPQLGVNRAVAAAQAAENKAFDAAEIRPDGNVIGAWDLAQIVVEALRHLPATAGAAQVRAYIANMRGFAGINGVYDFPKYPQRGLGRDGTMVARYDAPANDFVPASNPGGSPLKSK